MANAREPFENDNTRKRRHRSSRFARERQLSAVELKNIFSGAPHFILEKGRRFHPYPLVIFPWDNRYYIDRMQDRMLLSHPSFTLATLHTHLPIRWLRTGLVIQYGDRLQQQGSRRASFDIGIYEVPNMLSYMAREKGSIGFSHFLELPISDLKRYRPPARIPKAIDNSQATKPNYHSISHPGIIHDRITLVKNGPNSWKQLGIRDVGVREIAERLKNLKTMYNRIMQNATHIHLLDLESITNLHTYLYSTFLYPPHKVLAASTPDLKSQIDILMRILSVKGAWLDFSISEARIAVGQILFETCTLRPGHEYDSAGYSKNRDDFELERKWLLIHLVLSLELYLRIDAAVRLGIFQRSKGFSVTAQDTQAFNSLRTDKLSWDMVMSRRLVENLNIEYVPTCAKEETIEKDRLQPQQSSNSQSGGFMSRFRFKRRSSGSIPSFQDESTFSVVFTPQHEMRQLDGLLYFARTLRWPDFENIKSRLVERIGAASADPDIMVAMFGLPVLGSPLPPDFLPPNEKEFFVQSWTCRTARLNNASTDVRNDPSYIGGYLSRTWFSGLVLPGETVNHLLMSTLLENDKYALGRLGPIANFYGGFAYNGATWWSRSCIVSRVLSCLNSASECMGWVYTPIYPYNQRGEILSERWLEVRANDLVRQENQLPRIREISKVLQDSSPLGAEGGLTSSAFGLPLDDGPKNTARRVDSGLEIFVEKLILIDEPDLHQKPYRPRKTSASLMFKLHQPLYPDREKCTEKDETVVTMPLSNDVYFIASFPCAPPRGSIVSAKRQSDHHRHQRGATFGYFERSDSPEHHETGRLRRHSHPGGNPASWPRLPGHLLHMQSYPYAYLELSELAYITALPTSHLYAESLNDRQPFRKTTVRSTVAEQPPDGHISMSDSQGATSPKKDTTPQTTPTDNVTGNATKPKLPSTSKPARAASSGATTTGASNQKPRKPSGAKQPNIKITYIIDARDISPDTKGHSEQASIKHPSREREMYARAWCASVGLHAIVSQDSTTCLACSIREARAADVDIVIRTSCSNPEEDFGVSI